MSRALTLVVGSNLLQVQSGDLVDDQAARFPEGRIEFLSDVLGIALGAPLAALTADRLSVGFHFERPLHWDVQGIGITAVPESEGTITIRTAGELFRFSDATDDADPGHVQTVQVGPGQAYVSIEFRAAVTVAVSGAGAHGAFGVKGSIEAIDRFRIANHLAFDSHVPVRDALVQAFERFRLPYSAKSAHQVPNANFIEHEFYGKLNIGLAATFGLAGVTFGGRSGGEVKQSFRSVIGSVGLNAKPTFDLGAGVTVDYAHEDTFRMLLGGFEDRLRLWIFKADETLFSAGLRANLNVSLNARVQIEARVEEWLQKAAERLFASVGNEALRQRLTQQFVERLKSRKDELARFVEDREAQINGTLKRLNQLKIAASAGIERISENTALLTMDFNRSADPAAIEKAQQGDLLGAAQHTGVALGEGSFVRSELRRATTLRLQLFETFRASHIETYFEKSEVRYAGNGLFQFRFTTGTKTESDWFGHRKAVEMYFQAGAEATARGVIGDRDLQLCVKTFEQNNADAARRSAAMLHLLLRNTSHDGLDQVLQTAIRAQPALAVQVVVTFSAAAFLRLRATPFRSTTQPAELPHTADQANYAAFVEAVDRIYVGSGFGTEGFPNSVERYKHWAHYNVCANFQEHSSKPPNRRSTGNPVLWPQDIAFPAARVDTATRTMIRTFLIAAQRFMNLCEDLSMLARDLDEVRTREQFEELLEDLRDLVQANAGGHPLFFTKPVVAALFAQMQGTVQRVASPMHGAASDSFIVEIFVA
jgi:hypothetical protein